MTAPPAPSPAGEDTLSATQHYVALLHFSQRYMIIHTCRVCLDGLKLHLKLEANAQTTTFSSRAPAQRPQRGIQTFRQGKPIERLVHAYFAASPATLCLSAIAMHSALHNKQARKIKSLLVFSWGFWMPNQVVPRPDAAGAAHGDYSLPARRAGGEAEPARGSVRPRVGPGPP